MAKYWVANNPNSEIDDTKAQKLAELSATTTSLAELNSLDAGDEVQCTITPAATSPDDGDTVEFSVQLNDGDGTALTEATSFNYYVSSAADGLTLDAAVTTIASGGAGEVVPIVANQSGIGITDATGTCEIDITEAGADTVYLVVVKPDGKLTVSAAVTWAAP